jgi:hypothetical protein
MRALLVLAAVACIALPASAQQQESAADTKPVATAPTVAAPAQTAEAPAAPTLLVSREQIDAQLKAEPAVAGERQMNSSFWYTAAAVALGVIVALLLLD